MANRRSETERDVILRSVGVRSWEGMWWTGWGPWDGDGGSCGRKWAGTVIEIEEGSWRAWTREDCLRWAMGCQVGSWGVDMMGALGLGRAVAGLLSAFYW